MLTYKKATANDYNQIIEVWEKSIRATHCFLDGIDIDFYKSIIPTYFDNVDLLMWYESNTLVGFSGTSGTDLDMLFLEPATIGKGFGKYILYWLIEYRKIDCVDVNKQNLHAKNFYLKHGFEICSESEKDGFGKPYPILHLKKTDTIK